MASKVQHVKSSVPGHVPTALQLDYGELAINYADEKVYFKNSSDEVKSISGTKGDTGDKGDTGETGPTGPGVPTGGTAGQVLAKLSSTNFDTQWTTSKPFPTGTRMLFAQTSAPTGWVKDTSHDNKALRVVSGTAGQGGTHGFTSILTTRALAVESFRNEMVAGNEKSMNILLQASNQVSSIPGITYGSR